MVLCLVSTLNCQTTYAKEYNNEEIIIGEYDGPLQDFSVQTNNSSLVRSRYWTAMASRRIFREELLPKQIHE